MTERSTTTETRYTRAGRILLHVLLVLLIALLGAGLNVLKAQDLIEVSGVVTAQEGGTPLPGVAVQIKGKPSGTTTNDKGVFVLRFRGPLPATLAFTSIGYAPQEIVLNGTDARLSVA
ncbi:MAG: carboxypeptidase-like regulatory domain-containing protein, partial [Chitinophagaceae bacterium]